MGLSSLKDAPPDRFDHLNIIGDLKYAPYADGMPEGVTLKLGYDILGHFPNQGKMDFYMDGLLQIAIKLLANDRGKFINLLREKPCHFRARMDSAGRQSRPSLLQQANEVFSAAQYTGE